MSLGERCRECGMAIPADSPGGFCGQCMLGLGLNAEEVGPAPMTEAPAPPLPTDKMPRSMSTPSMTEQAMPAPGDAKMPRSM